MKNGRFLLLRLLAVAAAGALPAGAAETRNALFNGDFQYGAHSWRLVSADGRDAGARMEVVRQPVLDVTCNAMAVSLPRGAGSVRLQSDYTLKVRNDRKYRLEATVSGNGTVRIGWVESGPALPRENERLSPHYTLTPDAKTYVFEGEIPAPAAAMAPFVLLSPNPAANDAVRATVLSVSLPLPEDEIKQATAGHPAPEAEVTKLYEEKFKDFKGFSEAETRKIREAVRVRDVLAPYRPIRKEGEGLFALTTSRYGFKDSVFPASLRILGQEILTGGMTLDLLPADAPTGGPTADRPRFAGDGSEATAEQNFDYGGRLKANVKGVLSYDGLMIFTVRLSSREAVEVKSLSFTVPLDAKVARYARFDGFGPIVPGSTPGQYGGRWNESIEYGFGALPAAGEKTVLKYALLSGRWKNGWNPKVWGAEQPVVWEWTQGRGLHLADFWLGDEEKGLKWISESPSGWHYGTDDATFRLERRGDTLLARRVFITRPVKVRGTREIQFAIQALPPKKVRDDWFKMKVAPLFNAALARRIYRSLGETEKKTPVIDPDRSGNLAPMFPHTWCLGHGTPRAEDPDAFRETISTLLHFGSRPLPYMVPTHIAVNIPEGYHYGVKTEEWAIKPRTAWLAKSLTPAEMRGSIVKVCVNSFYSEFTARDVGKFIDDYGVTGLYFDNCTPGGCTNTGHGCGYTGEDGKLLPTVPFFALRRYFMMIRNEFLKRGKEPLIFCHAGVLPSELSFVDCVLSGEGLYGLDLSKSVSLEEFRAYMIGANQTGAVYFFLPQALGVDPKEAMKEKTVRRTLAMTLIHGTQIWPGFCHFGPVAKSREVLERLEEDRVRFLPYWAWDVNKTLNKSGVYASVYLQSERAVLALSNLSDGDADIEIPRAALEKEFRGLQAVKDPMDYFPAHLTSSCLRVRVPQRDFRLLLLEK